jgi:SAM-dependent methyltransferase
MRGLVNRLLSGLRRRLHLMESRDGDQLRRQIAALRKDNHLMLRKLHEAVRRVEKRATAAEKRAQKFHEHLVSLKTRVDTMSPRIRQLDTSNRRSEARASSSAAPPVLSGSLAVNDRDWRLLQACSICDQSGATLVCEYNRFALDPAPEPGLETYNYALCHTCGTVYASRRPIGERYRLLFENFTESLGRTPSENPILNPRPLTPEARVELQRRAQRGVFVSEHSGVKRRDWIAGLLSDRLGAARHVELLGSLLSLDRPRVLEIRSRTGAILDGLRRLYGADVSALAIFESQQLLLQTVYGIRADALIDFEDFRIPYDGQFDLIVSNHMMTHAISPRRFLSTLRERLRPGGHLYLYNEPDDAGFTHLGESIFGMLNPFHLQSFDRAALVRALSANGFSTSFVGHFDLNFYALAQKTDDAVLHPIDEKGRLARIAAYRRARDLAVLRLPEDLRGPFAHEWDAILERAVAAGLVEIGKSGRIMRTSKRKETAHHEVAYH